MNENIADLVEISFIGGVLIVKPKDGVIVSKKPENQLNDEWVDSFSDIFDAPSKYPLGTRFYDAQYAVAQLKYLMMQPCVNGDWVPDWNDDSDKWCIGCFGGTLCIDVYGGSARYLAFREEQIANKFRNKYRSYIEAAAPILFGVTIKN